MRVLVCGSRDFGESDRAVRERIETRLAKLPLGTTIVHGGARGTDALAGAAARALDLPVEVFLADWKTYGRRAGFVRNLAMLDTAPDLVIAFWNGSSSGTLHTIDEAKRRGLAVEVFPLAPPYRPRRRRRAA